MYKLREIIGKYDFTYHFKKIIVCYKKIGYNIDGLRQTACYKKTGYSIDVLRQTACLVVNPIMVNNFAYLFDCRTVGRASG